MSWSQKDSSTEALSDVPTSNLMSRVVSGSIGSVITSLLVTPLEVVKVRLQANSFEASAKTSTPPRHVIACPRGCGTFVLFNGQMECILPKSAVPFFDSAGKLTKQAKSAIWASPKSGELSTFGMVRRIFATEGLAGIYAGLRPTLVMAVPNTVIYFSAYDDIVWRLRELSANPSQSWIPLVAGGSSRFFTSSITAPFEYLRTRQASSVGQNQLALGLWQEFRFIVKTEGFRSLYRGLWPTLWRDVPFSAIYWFVLEKMKAKWIARFEGRMSPVQQAGTAFVNGAVSGMIAAACTTPFDVVKTRQQSLAPVAETIANPVVIAEACCHSGATACEIPYRLTGTFESMFHIARTEGIGSLWRGNQVRMLKVAPACAIMISSYEYGKRVLG
jgi:solute carrier family 25, member 39/40